MILIDGALCHRGPGPNDALGGLLAERGFTTYACDRRGRGESGDTGPYAVRARSRTSPRCSTPPAAPPRCSACPAERRAAVRQFLGEVGMPGPMIRMMALTPVWKKLKAVAPTLPNDMRIVAGHQQGRPLDAARWAGLAAPVTVIDGGRSPAWMRNGNAHLAEVLGADYLTLPGRTHMVKPKVLAPALASILSAAQRVQAAA